MQELGRADGPGRARICADHVRLSLESAREGYENGAPSELLLLRLAEAYDHLLTALYRAAGLPPAAMISVVALGGYGRSDLFPSSDLDLLLLHDGTGEQLAAQVVEHLVYPLWDARVSVGHAVRSIDETLDLAVEDLTVRTALLDGRLICGDEGPFHALEAGGLRRFFGPQRVQEFVAALYKERAQRHRRFGETEYLLEPNVKQVKGGLRDLNTALWAAKARFGTADLERFVEVGAGTRRQVRALQDAQEFLRRLRLAMHLEVGRAQDHLSFELQEALAPRLFPEVEVPGVKRQAPAVAPAVERLMHAFYRHARTVVLESDGVLQRCRLAGRQRVPSGKPATGQPDEHLVLTDRHILSVRPERFWEEPSEILRAFRLTLEHDVSLDRATQDVIAEAVADQPGAQLVADERAAALLMEILCSPERAAEGTVLEEMHHLGVVNAMVPEFEPCTGRIQHDLYHVYTVDLHSLYVVALLKAWRRGEQSERYPTPVALMSRLARTESLMLAALLHDVAKPLGHGHAAKGARLAAGVAARLGLDPEQLADVSFLVANHLLMAHVSQRRDLADAAMISSFAQNVGSVERVRQLYLLTCADTAMTAPGNLSEWKAGLLEELYMKTYVFLTRERDQLRQDRERRLLERQDALELTLRRPWGTQGVGIIPRVPQEMLLAYEVEDLAHHLGVVLELERLGTTENSARGGGPPPECGPIARDNSVTLRLATRQLSGGAIELTVCCSDSPGRLASITGVMLMHRIEVLAAQVYTLERRPDTPQGDRLVLDIFTVKLPVGAEETIWSSFSDDLERALSGELSVADEVRRRTRPSALKQKVLPRVPIGVTVDNQASDRHTVVEVQAPDRIGVLHAITHTLSSKGLEIHLSKVTSEAGRVVDIFYVSDGRSGGKVLDQATIESLQGSIADAIGALDPAHGSPT